MGASVTSGCHGNAYLRERMYRARMASQMRWLFGLMVGFQCYSMMSLIALILLRFQGGHLKIVIFCDKIYETLPY